MEGGQRNTYSPAQLLVKLSAFVKLSACCWSLKAQLSALHIVKSILPPDNPWMPSTLLVCLGFSSALADF